MAGKTDGKIAKIDDVTTDESRLLFETGTDELLERLTIGEVLAASDQEGWKFKTERLIRDANSSFSDNYNKMRILTDDYDIDKFYRETNPKVTPLSDRLIYSYDYGDGWQIEITCVDEYEIFDRGNESSDDGFVIIPKTKEAIAEDQHPVDKNVKETEGELRNQIISVIIKHKPVCVSADGLPLLDDVGGIGGYCAFLLGVHGQECGAYDYNDKEETIEWGRSMGWNGRMNKPENIL